MPVSVRSFGASICCNARALKQNQGTTWLAMVWPLLCAPLSGEEAKRIGLASLAVDEDQ